MQKNFSRFISYILHPAFLTFYMALYLLLFSQNLALQVPGEMKIKYLATIGYTTLVFPPLLTFLLWRLNFVESLHLQNRTERYIPLIASIAFYFWVFWVFHKSYQAGFWIQYFLFTSFLTIVLCFLFTLFIKVSLHLACISALFTVSFILNISCLFQDTLLLIACSIGLVLIWFSRKSLQAHTSKEIVLGLAIGIFSAGLAFPIIKQII